MKRLIDELKVYGLNDCELETISDKDGVVVARVYHGSENYVLKYFEKEEYRREIGYYKLLNELGMKTIQVIKHTEKSLLMEDIVKSETYRLGKPEDLKNELVVAALGRYYKKLHEVGEKYLKNHSEIEWYSELSLLTPENIDLVRDKSGYHNDDYWKLLRDVLSELDDYYKDHRTITYNDFFHGNMIVSHDLTEAFVFDYNFLGEGLRYFDISNVTYDMTPEMKACFLKAYGNADAFEKKMNEILSPMIGLIIAYNRTAFPKWAEPDLKALSSGELYKKLRWYDNFRWLSSNDQGFITEMLYQAIYIPEGQEKPSRDIVNEPKLKKYHESIGKVSDFGLIALDRDQSVGAAWLRCFDEDDKGWGYVSSEIPELSMAIDYEYRNKGIGKKLLKELLEASQSIYPNISLSVDLDNYAFYMYENLGFEVVRVEGNTAVMLLKRGWDD